MRALIEFLTSRGYGHMISPKILTRPTGRDFQHIIAFLFGKIDPHFLDAATAPTRPDGSGGGRFEDAVIAMFKALRYPFPLSKTALVAVGSPHTWPPLLAAIMWLVELLSYDEAAKGGPGVIGAAPGFSEADPVREGEQIFHAYLFDAYHLFLEGDDAGLDTRERELARRFDARASSRSRVSLSLIHI